MLKDGVEEFERLVEWAMDEFKKQKETGDINKVREKLKEKGLQLSSREFNDVIEASLEKIVVEYNELREEVGE